MSLLPRALQFRDEALSLPLGAARKPVAPPKWDPVWLFNHGDHPAGTVDDYTPITEADCRQIKGAAKVPQASTVSGDAVKPVTPDAAPPSTEKPPKFAVGDRVRAVADGSPCYAGFREGAIGVVIAVGVITRVDFGEQGRWAVGGYEYLVELIPSEPKEADGWIAFNWRTDRAPSDWAERLYDIRVCSAGTLKEFKGQRNSFASSEAWHVTHYRPSQKQ